MTVSIHAPRAGRDLRCGLCQRRTVSIHAPRAGRDQTLDDAGRTRSFNPRAPRGARRGYVNASLDTLKVSIHAPRAGRDSESRRCVQPGKGFNPRAPRGARPRRRHVRSTATTGGFNPRAPRGARRCVHLHRLEHVHVSIHAPRAGRDEPPAEPLRYELRVSIHAPRAGRDHARSEIGPHRQCVSIHAPRAGRDPGQVAPGGVMLIVSIHAPRAGRDPWPTGLQLHWNQFQSTRPARGATASR